MGDLASRIEITKLARELRAEESDLEFLSGHSPAELRELRDRVSHALFTRHEERVRRIAALSRMLPVGVTAKIAEHAMGAVLCARVAAVMDPREAAKLAGHFSPDFLAEVAVSLDPARVAGIVGRLDDRLVVTVGRRLLADGEYLTLGRFVTVVSPEVALGVVEGADAEALLRIALFCDDPARLDPIAAELSDGSLAEIVVAADEADAYDAAVMLLTALTPATCGRLVAQVGAVRPGARDALVAAVAEHDVWGSVLPALDAVDQDTLHGLVNVPATLDHEVVDRVVERARELDLAPVLVRVVLALDDAHLSALRESRTLRDPEVQQWLIERGGVSEGLVVPVLESLGVR